MEKFNKTKKEFEAILKKIATFDKVPNILREAILYSLIDGGKRVRPVIFIETLRVFGKEMTEQAKKFCVAIESLHIYTLIHDDLPSMDDDDFRRGKPSCHKKFGEGIAILAGDSLLNYAYELILECIAETKCEKFMEAGKVFSKLLGANGLIGGQSLDIFGDKMTDENLNYIFENKTVALLKSAALCGAIIGGATKEEQEFISKFIYHFGFAFQIRDDMIESANGEEPSFCDFVGFYGIEKAKIELENHTQKALVALGELKQDTSFLEELTLFASKREY
ncbi:MAG: polyprenyl synthetase family protein [Firmicutes bacterium]|nr:polyprenyl synthetase family protein [Bacillota bacterium]MCL2255682.1 polyprenyl synthetase family protein [Bacillota bacterium]